MVKYILQTETEYGAKSLTLLINDDLGPDYATQNGVQVILKGPIPEKMLSALVGVINLAEGIRVRRKGDV